MMTRNEFKDWAGQIRLFDGSTGVALNMRGMPGGVSTEKWIMDNPEIFLGLQQDYVKAGSKVLLSPTFGANRLKMKTHGMNDVVGVNKTLVKISKDAAGDQALVAAELGPTGEFMAPMGLMTFEDIVATYREQVEAMLEIEPDFFILETFIDLAEARAAVIAIRDVCDLPIVASMTFDGGRTLSGNTPEAVAVTLEAAGADAVGANCSTGPKEVAQVIAKMAQVTELPLFAKPNAGNPVLVEGVTTFPMGAEDFAAEAKALVRAGATLIGGCCGTLPEHIAVLKETMKDMKPATRAKVEGVFLASPREALQIKNNDPLVVIGERINPTGQPKLAKSFVDGDVMPCITLAKEQVKDGAKILDVNVGAAGADEVALLKKLASELPIYCPVPLCFDTPNAEAMEGALRNYCGRALLNSASAEEGRMEPMLKLAKRYGAMVVLLPFAEGPPTTAEERMANLKTLMTEAEKHGLTKKDVVVDGAFMAVATDAKAPSEVLKFIKMCAEEGYLTMGGLSNVSFGLPQRDELNMAFLTMLCAAGMNLAIARPCEETEKVVSTSAVLTGRDEWCMNWIQRSRAKN